MADRREALKIIGAIGTTCAFPFASGELYGQHQHPPEGKQAEAGKPEFSTDAEFAVLSRIADLIVETVRTHAVPPDRRDPLTQFVAPLIWNEETRWWRRLLLPALE